MMEQGSIRKAPGAVAKGLLPSLCPGQRERG